MQKLIEAFALVRNLIPNARLLIIGSRSFNRPNEAFESYLCKPRVGVDVRIKTYWEPAALREALSEADIFCLLHDPTAEGNSATAANVLGMGRPVVVSSAQAFNDLRAWCVTSETHPGALAAKIVQLLTDPEAYKHAAARAKAGASYRDPKLIVEQYRRIAWQALLDRQA